MKIAILGNNLTARAFSAILNHEGLCNTIFYKPSDSGKFDAGKFETRTMAVSIGNMQILERILGFKPDEIPKGRIEKIAIFNSEKSIFPEVTFDAAEFGYCQMGFIFNYNALNSAIESAVMPEQYATEFSEISNYDLVVITDAAVAKYANLTDPKKVIAHDYNECAITLNIKHKFSHKNTAIEWFTGLGPLASLPMEDKHHSNIVRTVPRDIASAIEDMPEQGKHQFVHDHLIGKLQEYLGAIEIVSPVHIFPLYLNLKKQPDAENTIYLGSSNYAMHPIAGQGFNLILRDIQRLVTVIKTGNVQDFKHKAMRRKIDVSSMLFATHCLNEMFKIKQPIVRYARSIGMHMINKIPLLKRGFVRNAIGKGIFNSV